MIGRLPQNSIETRKKYILMSGRWKKEKSYDTGSSLSKKIKGLTKMEMVDRIRRTLGKPT